MKKHVLKFITLGLLSTLAFLPTVLAENHTETAEIDYVETWPEELSHQEEVYVDAKISNHRKVDRAWIAIEKEGNTVKTGALKDSNNDGYYVSPVAFTAEGAEKYEITVIARDKYGEKVTEEVSVDIECDFSIGDKCFY